MAKSKAKEVERKASVFISYSQYSSGGEVCKGDEDSAWPSYEPEEIDVTLGELMLLKEMRLQGDSVEVDFDPTEYIGKPLYLVYVLYTTGSTFGSSHGNPCFPACFTDAEKAFETAKAIETGTYGKDATGYVSMPWVGYFESLDSVEVVVKQLLDGR